MKRLKESVTDKVLQGFLTAVLFTGMDSEDNPLDSNFDTRDFDKDSYRLATKIVDAFISQLSVDPETICDTVGQKLENMGINIWFTMTGQGANFLDGDWDDYEDELYNLAKKLTKKYYVEGATSWDDEKVSIF